LVETEDKDGAEAEQMPNKYSAGAGADDYHEDGTNHTHFTNLDLERKKNLEMDYQDSGLTVMDYDAIILCDGEKGPNGHGNWSPSGKFKCPLHNKTSGHKSIELDSCEECALFQRTSKDTDTPSTTTTTDLIHERGTNHTLPKVKMTGNSYLKQRIIQKIPDDYHEAGNPHTHSPIVNDPPLTLEQLEKVKPILDQKIKKIKSDDYHETGSPHTLSPDDLQTIYYISTLTTLEAGQDYHDTGYYHTHSPDSIEEGNIEGGNDSHSSDEDGGNEAIGKNLEELLAKIPTKERTGKDYHDTGFAHTHSPKGRRNNKRTRNKKRKTSKKRTPKRMRPRWSNVD